MITKLKSTSLALLKKCINKKTKHKPQEPELVFEHIQGLVVSNMYLRMYETVYAGVKVFKQTNTKRDRYGHPKGKPNTFYFVDGLDKEFKNLSDLLILIDKGKIK